MLFYLIIIYFKLKVNTFVQKNKIAVYIALPLFPLSVSEEGKERSGWGEAFQANLSSHKCCIFTITMPVILKTAILLILSNIFMTVAWYAHLKNLGDKKWYIAALVSWGIAFFEYMIQVPANRIGYTALSLPQLKIMQEIITLSVFVPFALFYMHQPMKLNYLWAALCMIGAAYFIFKT